MFPSFAIRETLFPTSTFDSKKQIMLLLHGRNISCFQAAWKHVSRCIPVLPQPATYITLSKAEFPPNMTKRRFIHRHKTLYEAVSSSDNTSTIVWNAPSRFLFSATTCLVLSFVFSVLHHPPTGPQGPQAEHSRIHRPFCRQSSSYNKTVADQSRPHSPKV